MACVNLQAISRVCADNGIAIGQTDLIRMVCNECADQEVCPANSVYPNEVGSKDDSTESTPHNKIAINVHALGTSD